VRQAPGSTLKRIVCNDDQTRNNVLARAIIRTRKPILYTVGLDGATTQRISVRGSRRFLPCDL